MKLSDSVLTSDCSQLTPISKITDDIYYYGGLTYSTEYNPNYLVGQNQKHINPELYDNNCRIVNEIYSIIQDDGDILTSSGITLPIFNPLTYLAQKFPGWTFSNYDYNNLDVNNEWIEPYVININNGCVVFSTAAIIHYWRPNWLFDNIVNICKYVQKQMWPNSSDYTVPTLNTVSYVQQVLTTYNLQWWNTGSYYYNTWSYGKAQIDAGNPFMLCLATGGGYYNHAVTAFAWTTFLVQNGSLSGYQNFFKIHDGYQETHRYICTDDMFDGLDFIVYVS